MLGEPLAALYFTWQIAAFVLGAVIGSFLNVAIIRIPEDRSVISPPSACPACDTRLGVDELVPILSWLTLRGRCKHCGTPISPIYPLIELLTGLVAWLIFHRFVPDPSDLDLAHLVAFGVYLVFASLLIVSTFTDVRYRIIPEQTSLYAMPVGVLGAMLLEWLAYDGWLALGWRSSVLGVAVGGGFFAAMSWVYASLRGEVGLGWGDVRLMAMIGGFVGVFPGTWFAMLLSSMVGSVLGLALMVGSKERPHLPFAPALSLGALMYVLYGDILVTSILPGAERWL